MTKPIAFSSAVKLDVLSGNLILDIKWVSKTKEPT